jgi:uncharacterized protein (DUF4213/DUF364 family)
LRERVAQLDVLELHPQAGDLPASRAPDVIPQAQVVALTSMTFINGTIAGLLQLCSPEAFVVALGPSTPLSPRLFEYGIDLLSGSVVENIRPVLAAVEKGANFRQLHPLGVHFASIARSDLGLEDVK